MARAQTADLDIEYRDDGPRDGRVVLLLHGWPDDVSTWDDVAPRLHAAGLRAITPTLRGFSGTHFRNEDAPRTGNSAIHAVDMMALAKEVGLDRFSIAGQDWGSNIAEALAVAWPERVERLALLSTPPRLRGMPTPPFFHAKLEWYHWFQATKRGAAAVRNGPRGFERIMWENWSPPEWFDEATFARVARSFDNPDFVDVTLHSYRSRWDEAEPDPRSVWLEDKVKATKQLSSPAVFVQGEVDGVNLPAVSEKVHEKLAGPFECAVLPVVDHFPAREAGPEVAALPARRFSNETAS